MVKKIPMRQCVGCREMKPKSELARIVKNADGMIQFDTQGKMPGRGAYLCKSNHCLKKGLKNRGLERGLSSKIPTEIYSSMEQVLQDLEQEVMSS